MNDDHLGKGMGNENGEPAAPPSPGRGGGEASAPIAAPQGRAKSGAPTGNVNAQAHGAWSFLALGRLPRGGSYIRRLLGELRRELERCVVQSHGEVRFTYAAMITTVCRHEGRALLLSRYLALEGDGIKLPERMSMLEAIGRATDARDKAIKALALDSSGESSPWAAIDRLRAQQAIKATPMAASVPAATPERHAGHSAKDAGDNRMPLIPPGF